MNIKMDDLPISQMRSILSKLGEHYDNNHLAIKNKINLLLDRGVLKWRNGKLVISDEQTITITDPDIRRYITSLPIDINPIGTIELFDIKINFNKPLGNERPAVVFSASNYDKELVCKYVDPSTTDIKDVESELNVFLLDHPNVIKYYYAFESLSGYYIIMDQFLCDLGQAIDPYNFDLYHRVNDRLLSDQTVTDIFNQMYHAVNYIHKHKISHRDIKFGNFFVDNNLKIVLADFGMSYRWHEETTPIVEYYAGTPETFAPELYAEIPHLVTAPDVWALGVCLFELLTGDRPYNKYFDDELDKEEIVEILSEDFEYNRNRPAYMNDVCSALLEVDWRKRINLNAVTNYQWILNEY